jgi:hypothetical protein
MEECERELPENSAQPLQHFDANYGQKRIHEKGIMMGSARCEHRRRRTSRSKDGSRQSSKGSEVWRPDIPNGEESADTEDIDRLLLSSLRLWEVERDLIEERIAAKKSVRTGSRRRSDVAA